MSYNPFGGVHPEAEGSLGCLNRDGVSYRWLFRNGQLYCGIWVSDRTWSGYQYQTRVA